MSDQSSTDKGEVLSKGLARHNETQIFKHLRDAGQKSVAGALGVSPSTVSRLKDEDIPKFAALLAEIGLQVVPFSTRIYDPEMVDALTVLAKRYLESQTERLE